MSESRNTLVDSGLGTAGGTGSMTNGNGASSSTAASDISNPLAAILARAQQQQQQQQQQGYSSVDPNAALMMSNAAATIAAVAAQAMQQMAGHQPSPPTGFPSSLYAALQASQHNNNNNNQLVSAATQAAPAPSSLPSPHAALLAALTGGGHQPQTALSGLLSGNNEAAAALLRSTGAMVSQPTTSAGALTSPALLSSMQSWSLQRLEQHVSLLQQSNQAIPQSVAMLLAEAKKKEKKKNAKRVANRKSASTSRARKKALVEEMTKTNARLKRQALILSLLPDLVITTTPEGEITFCSAQVERILQYKPNDLVGAKLYELVVPSSRDALKCLIEELTHPGKAKAARASAAAKAKARRGSKRRMPDQRASGDETGASKATEENANGDGTGSARTSSGSGQPSTQATAGAAVVSEQSFPLSVVEVESKQRVQNPKPSATNENLETSTNNSGASGEEDSNGVNPESKRSDSKKCPRSDDSSMSSDPKNLRANDNLDRNVRWHNQRMLQDNLKASSDDGPKDDVTGASVTANNAGARLSSLKHVPEAAVEPKKDDKDSRYENPGDQSSSDDSLLAGVEEKKKGESTSDDSGYRESNDSREETSSSGSDTSQSNDRRKKHMAPTIRMCLIRDDLTTVWCEVTSSIRECYQDEETGEETMKISDGNDTTVSRPEQKELLLCLRPVRDGDKTVDESLRFCPQYRNAMMDAEQEFQDPFVSSGSIDMNDKGSTSSSSIKPLNRPPKKRVLASSSMDSFSTPDEAPQTKRSKSGPKATDDTEKSVVESLLKMNKSSQ